MSISVQFLKFLLVGALNTLFGYSVFAALVLAGVPPVPALVLTYVVGVLFNFMTTRRYVFSASAGGSLLRFIAAYVVIYFFNLGLYKAFEAVGAVPLVAQALCLPVVAVFSFLVFKFQVFRDPR
ncbi:MAG TPA: GtrA family protein [Usitatibacter sp.]|nr:GtrA family protein [Usitatibacter sp.]